MGYAKAVLLPLIVVGVTQFLAWGASLFLLYLVVGGTIGAGGRFALAFIGIAAGTINLLVFLYAGTRAKKEKVNAFVAGAGLGGIAALWGALLNAGAMLFGSAWTQSVWGSSGLYYFALMPSASVEWAILSTLAALFFGVLLGGVFALIGSFLKR